MRFITKEDASLDRRGFLTLPALQIGQGLVLRAVPEGLHPCPHRGAGVQPPPQQGGSPTGMVLISFTLNSKL